MACNRYGMKMIATPTRPFEAILRPRPRNADPDELDAARDLKINVLAEVRHEVGHIVATSTEAGIGGYWYLPGCPERDPETGLPIAEFRQDDRIQIQFPDPRHVAT